MFFVYVPSQILIFDDKAVDKESVRFQKSLWLVRAELNILYHLYN